MTVKTAVGTFTVHPLDPVEDAPLLHRWVTHPKAAFWMMQEAKLHDVEREYMAIAASEHHEVVERSADAQRYGEHRSHLSS